MATPEIDMDVAGFGLMTMGMGADKIYSWFHDGKGPEQTTDVSDQTFSGLSTGHKEVARIINDAVTKSGAAWEGAAGDAARANTSPLATWADATGNNAEKASDQSYQLGSAFRQAKNSVQQPVDVPDKPWYNDAIPWDTDYDDAVEKSQQVNSANMQVLNTYASTANSVSSGMPTFESPTGSGVEIGKVEPPTPPIIEHPPPQFPGDRNGGDKTGTDRTGGDTTGTSQWKPPEPGTGGNDDNTGKSDAGGGGKDKPQPPPTFPPGRPGDPNDPRTPPGIPPGVPGRPGDPNDPRNRGRVPGGPGGPGGGKLPGGPGGPGGGAGRGGGGGSGVGGPGGLGGPGAGRLGGAAAAGMGPGGSAGVMGSGQGQGGFGPGGAGAAGGGAGRAGAAGAAGMGGMGAGAGRGQGDEDKEHKSASYLQETEDIFGDGTMVAPPVIGG